MDMLEGDSDSKRQCQDRDSDRQTFALPEFIGSAWGTHKLHIDTCIYLPNTGTEDAVGGAASTKMSNSTKKLANILIAEI